MKLRALAFAASAAAALAAEPTLTISTPLPAPAWAKLERQLLAEQPAVCREFFEKYYDARGYIQCFVRWGANDGPDDAFENFNGWPELHALGASDDVKKIFLHAHEGMIKQYTEAKTTEVPAGRGGMYYKEYSAQSDWMHHGEGLQLFNRMPLSLGARDPLYGTRVRRFAGFYMGEDPEAPNYDPQRKLIRSMMNGSRGPMLRKATALDWVGDSFDVGKFVALHGESTYAQFLAHYEEYTDVAGDHFLNLVATTLPTNAFMATGDAKYKTWMRDYMDAWLERMRQNGGIIPSFVDVDGKIGGANNKWWGNAYGWGFSPVNPVNGRREHRNRIPRAAVGFANAILVTGDLKYADAWRGMMDAVNAHARVVAPASSRQSEGRQDAGATSNAQRKEFPTMHGAQGWYGWQSQPWNVGALDLWYWTMRADDRARIGAGGGGGDTGKGSSTEGGRGGGPGSWLAFLEGKEPNFPETALRRDLATVARRVEAMRKDQTPPDRRLADNMMDLNPATIGALTQLMQGGLVPGRDGGLLHARLRYFDPERRRAGVPEDVGALVSELSDTGTVVTLVNLNATQPRTVIVQGGAYGEHRIESVGVGGKTQRVGARAFTVKLEPGAGAKLALTMQRYAEAPTVAFPWER